VERAFLNDMLAMLDVVGEQADDPAIEALTFVAYPDDADADLEYQGLVEPDLERSRVSPDAPGVDDAYEYLSWLLSAMVAVLLDSL
jgi:hypothetical protein